MKKQLTQVEFRGTKEQEAKLLEIIDAHKNERGAMMPILQQAQEVYGYLPVEVMQIIESTQASPLKRFSVLRHSTLSLHSTLKVRLQLQYALVLLATLRVAAIFMKSLASFSVL